ncbi:MAG: hypothetical protein F2796_02125 [Actinobacteria bacterium]|nr:hypothetical protein [Actinomycetota bacterium]
MKNGELGIISNEPWDSTIAMRGSGIPDTPPTGPKGDTGAAGRTARLSRNGTTIARARTSRGGRIAIGTRRLRAGTYTLSVAGITTRLRVR